MNVTHDSAREVVWSNDNVAGNGRNMGNTSSQKWKLSENIRGGFSCKVKDPKILSSYQDVELAVKEVLMSAAKYPSSRWNGMYSNIQVANVSAYMPSTHTGLYSWTIPGSQTSGF